MFLNDWVKDTLIMASFTSLFLISAYIHFCIIGGGRVERGILLVWVIVGQGPIALAVGAGGGCLDIFSPIYLFSFLSPSL